ncbi:hypothetical protein Q4566_10565 [Tamlana sp. 2_MG-2023]|uniref:hypothetical protein n=1 Tax=unclassified Tamlana TaxID=2614803 RepID=UPI0026E3FD4F|nr:MULTISPECIES: hypothetical protein [unclassified Tamlana]MDO6760642.1 hypothetical protein [Tamlana sp. 2_MG-2023]MDO6790898.1 hypothetical protein [Tamlana sp. 1_MG-2023]
MFNFDSKATREDCKFIIDIIKNYSEDQSIKKLISPISDEYYLLDEKNQVSICIADDEIILANHIYLYKKTFNLAFTSDLKKIIKKQMESEMQELKKTLFKNEIDLLDKILDLSARKKKSLTITPNLKSS